MASDVTVIGRTSFVRGRLSGPGDLEILGRVEGEVEMTGELVIDAHALVAANLTARRMVVRGAVKGDLTAVEGVSLEDGARVVGDVRAPRISIAPGALLRGYVQTSDGAAATPRAKAQAPMARIPAKAPAVLARPAAPVVRPAPIPLAAEPAKKMVTKAGPPAPIVPALRKGAKSALHKKRAG